MTAARDEQLPVMTVLEAHVQPERWSEFVQLYQRNSTQRPPQMLGTFLVQGVSDATLWRAISVWRSRAALDEYRRSVATPGGVAMFRAVGAEPTLTMWSVTASSPQAASAGPLDAPPRDR